MTMTPQMAVFLKKFATNAATQVPKMIQPSFGNTAQGRYLKGVKQEGLYDQGQESKIIGDVATKANTQAALSNKNYQGQMINKGTEGSVANIRAAKESEQNVRNQVGQTASDLFFNEQSAKKDAEAQLAAGTDKVKAEKRNAFYSALSGGVSAGVEGLVDAQQNKGVQTVMGDYQTGKDKDPQKLFESLTKIVGYEQAIKIMTAMAGGA